MTTAQSQIIHELERWRDGGVLTSQIALNLIRLIRKLPTTN